MVDVTISIVSGGDPELLAACLRTIPAAAGEATVEVVVTDNRSDGALAEIEQADADVRWIRNERMAGFGSNHNRALGDATGRYLFVLNDDTELDP